MAISFFPRVAGEADVRSGSKAQLKVVFRVYRR